MGWEEEPEDVLGWAALIVGHGLPVSDSAPSRVGKKERGPRGDPLCCVSQVCYRAYSTARVSRMTVTRICPG